MLSRSLVVCTLAAALGAAATVTVFALAPTGRAQSGGELIPYFEDLTSKRGGFAVLDVKVKEKGHVGANAGSTVIFSSILRTERRGPVIGRDVVRCTTSGFGYDFCRGAILITGRGTLIIDGLAPSAGGAHVRTLPIVGGTYEFVGARGYVQSAKESDSGPGIHSTIHLVK